MLRRLEILHKCASKADAPLAELTVLEPEADFPSSDGKHPLSRNLYRLHDSHPRQLAH